MHRESGRPFAPHPYFDLSYDLYWEFDKNGLMRRRDASINDYEIDESECK